MSSKATPERQAAMRGDTSDLHRGVATNFLGYLLKLGNPVLLVLVVRAYGAAEFGLYTIAQALMMFAARVGVYGFDKGLLWSIPRESAQNKLIGVRPALRVSTLLGLAVMAIFLLAANDEFLRYLGAEPGALASLRIMSVGVLIQGWMDLLVHASLGMRRMAAQVFAKETIVPAVFVLGALACHGLGLEKQGLAIAFVLSNLAGLAASVLAFRSTFAGIPWPEKEGRWPSAELRRYAGPMWLTEMANSLLQRIDTYAVGFLTQNLALVGVYAVVTRFSNSIRQIRRSFDPIVLAIVSEISAKRDAERLRESYSHATFLVGITQVPVFAFIWTFSEPILRFFGEEFTVGAQPLVILCAFWMVNSVVSLSGIVVSAYGYSRLTLQTVLVAIAALASASYLLIPRFGLVGAASAVSIGYGVQSVMQVIQMRVVSGSWNFRSSVFLPLGLGLFGALAATLCHALLTLSGVTVEVWVDAAAFGAFSVVYGFGLVRLWQQGILRGNVSSRS